MDSELGSGTVEMMVVVVFPAVKNVNPVVRLQMCAAANQPSVFGVTYEAAVVPPLKLMVSVVLKFPGPHPSNWSNVVLIIPKALTFAAPSEVSAPPLPLNVPRVMPVFRFRSTTFVSINANPALAVNVAVAVVGVRVVMVTEPSVRPIVVESAAAGDALIPQRKTTPPRASITPNNRRIFIAAPPLGRSSRSPATRLDLFQTTVDPQLE